MLKQEQDTITNVAHEGNLSKCSKCLKEIKL